MNLQERIEQLFAEEKPEYGEECFRAFDELKAALNEGCVRAAEPDPTSPTGWKVNAWVKKGILLGFRIGQIVEMRIPDRGSATATSSSPKSDGGEGAGAAEIDFQFLDKHTFPLKQIPSDRGIRIVPGGSAIRDGCYIGRGVVCMPPMYINVGAYVDEQTMIDSHALVGSCAQIGKRVHLSAGAQIGGVLEPIGALPVIVEDDVLVGGNCGVYEGAVVKQGAVLAAGTVLTGSTPVHDLVRDAVYRRQADVPLIIPAGAVVVPGARAVTKGRAKEWGLSLYTPIIIKYRDEQTEQSARREDLLR